MAIHDPLNGFAVGMADNPYATNCATPYFRRIARTTDGGETWAPVLTTAVNCSYFWKMSWPSPEVGYVSHQQNGPYKAVVFYKTTDGGATWSHHEISLSDIGASSFYLQGIGFVDEARAEWAATAIPRPEISSTPPTEVKLDPRRLCRHRPD